MLVFPESISQSVNFRSPSPRKHKPRTKTIQSFRSLILFSVSLHVSPSSFRTFILERSPRVYLIFSIFASLEGSFSKPALPCICWRRVVENNLERIRRTRLLAKIHQGKKKLSLCGHAKLHYDLETVVVAMVELILAEDS